MLQAGQFGAGRQPAFAQAGDRLAVMVNGLGATPPEELYILYRKVAELLDGRGLKPLAPPKVEEVKLDEGQPMSFKAVFETLPLIELPDWRGLRASAKAPNVTDEDVDKEVDRLREEAARYDPVEEARPTQAGDYVLLDLYWRPLDGGKGRSDWRK